MDNNLTPFDLANLRKNVLPMFATVFLSLCVVLSVSGQQPDGQSDGEKAAQKDPDLEAAPTTEVHQVAWLHDVADAQERAARRNVPVLLIAGATWCGPCRLLDEELEDPSVQRELERWVAVHIDVDSQPEEATRLAVSGIPALRILTPSGRVIGSREGLLSAEEIVSWLHDQHEQASPDLDTTDWSPGKLNARQVVRILKAFRSREANIREAATTRLMAAPEIAAAPVVAQFVDSSLAERLACLDLLDAWEAPIEGLDPWIPATITDERLKQLQDWVEAREFPSQASPDSLDAVTSIEVRRLIRSLKTATGTAAFSIREQLARIGSAALPLIKAEIEKDIRPEVQAALNLARYRIAASNRYLASFSGDLEKLVARNFDERIAAVDRLIAAAESSEEGLLLELFSDPVPLVRELALKGLTKIRGSSASGALVELLDDEDPNVRVAVLQQLSENPSPQLVPRIAKYIETEDDPDLVVHAVRFYKAVSTVGAAAAMAKVLDHPSWRVRAEAAEGLAAMLDDYKLKSLKSDSTVADKLIPLLADEDDYVAQQAIQGLVQMDVRGLKKKLIATIDDRPDVAATIVRSLKYHWSQIDGGLEKLRELINHDRPDIRAAVAEVLTSRGEDQDGTLIAQALRDTNSTVRLVTAQKLFERIAGRFERGLSPEMELGEYGGGRVFSRTPNGSNVTITIDADEVGTASGGLLSGLMNLFSGSGETQPPPVDFESPSLVVDNSNSPQDGSAEQQADTPDSDWQSQLKQFVATHDVDASIQSLGDALKEEEVFSMPTVQLQVLFESENADEKLAAALSLSALGNDDAWNFILERATERKNLTVLADLLPLVTWDRKQVLFQRLLETSKAESEYATIVSTLAESFDQRSSTVLWDLLNEDFVTDRMLGIFARSLWQSHFSDQHYGTYDLPDDELRYLKLRAAEVVESGSAKQKVMALAMLALKNTAPALEAAKKILKDESASAQLKADAIQISLCTLPEEEAQALAVETLQAGDPLQIQPALKWLTMGNTAVMVLRDSIFLESVSMGSNWTLVDLPKVLRPKVPDGLTIEDLQPFLNSEDKVLSLCASYQAVLLGQRQYLPRVLSDFEQATDDEQVYAMTYRAIAAANATESIDVLKRIYAMLVQSESSYEISEFYWTIRIMTGPELIQFRGQIRSEQGAQSLRWQRDKANQNDFDHF